MTITYVTSGPWGSGTGIPKSAAVADAMIWDLVQQIEAAVAGAATPVGISAIISDGANLTVVLTDASTQGPFALPRPPQRPTVSFPVTDPSYTPVLSQASYYFRFAADGEFIIPPHGEVAYPIDVEIYVVQCGGETTDGAGTVVFTAGSNTAEEVVINPVKGKINATFGQGAVVGFKQVAINVWDKFGGLADEATT